MSARCLLLLLIASADMAWAAESDADFFERRIRPVLVEHCYECHSVEAGEPEGGLRLDDPAALRAGGNSGPAVVPGRPAESLLLEALHHQSLQMPPDRKLPEPVLADFADWIARGAPDPRGSELASVAAGEGEHWAFQPPRRGKLPEITGDEASTAIDRFVLARLQTAGLSLSPPADRRTLIRRLTFDLTGLPPTPEEIDAFTADQSADAYARLVDRLLASPAYGERWGRHWLDVARYADNKGYVFFESKEYPWAYAYRDYVVQAWNEDLPYDQFVIEQLAADQLDLDGDRERLAAMGFLTAGARFMNNVHDIVDDRVDVVTRGLMGLTVTCARCHDHKYDPIPTEDYYALYGVFRSSVEPLLPPRLVPAGSSDADRQFEAGMQERLQKLEQFIAEQRAQIIEGARTRAGEYLLAVHQKRQQPDTENFMLLTDKGDLNPAMIHRWEKYLERARRAGDSRWRIWHAYSDLPADQFQQEWPRLRTTVVAQTAEPLRSAFDRPPVDMADVAQRYGKLLSEIDQQWQNEQRTAAMQGRTPPEQLDDPQREELRQVLYGAQSPAMIPRELSWGFLDLLPDRPTQDEFKKLLGEVESFSTQQPNAPPRAMVLLDAETPYEPAVFVRGNPYREGPVVPRRFPRVLARGDSAPYSRGSGRLELARDIVDPANPLTARVLVNRIWLHHFGRGLVETPSDFGLRSTPPSHPALLDWLAAELVARGWSIKQLHRVIVLSATYQQSSTSAPAARDRAAAVDPENQLYWRAPRRRLEFEAMRDALLAATGTLDQRLGGPPLPLLERFIPRRTLYGFVDRMDLPGLMRTFDFPDPAATSPQRDRTTVPPQALFFMNDRFVAQCAQRLAEHPAVVRLDPRDRISELYRRVLGRDPDEFEVQMAEQYLASRPAAPRGSAWQYGFGAMADEASTVQNFTPLTHWTGSKWQVGPSLPDPKLGWVYVDRSGGHPSATMDRCSVRRWVAPAALSIRIDGMLRHTPEEGNGVRGRLVSSRQGILGEWKVHHSEAATGPLSFQVEPGEAIDLVVDFQGEISHDQHEWTVTIEDQAGAAVWDSQRDFRGPAPDPWAELVHALLMTNEFVFID